jgi:hypothetical protein
MSSDRWQDTLFVWRGKVESNNFSGVWVGSATNEEPSDAAFDSEASNTFSCVRNKNDTWTCSYKLEGRSHKDKPQKLVPVESDGFKHVICRSQNEFGW